MIIHLGWGHYWLALQHCWSSISDSDYKAGKIPKRTVNVVGSVSCFVALATTTPTLLKTRLPRGSPRSFASLSFGAMFRRLGPTLPRVKSFTMWSLCFFWGFCLSSSFPDFELGAISQRRYCKSLQQARRWLDRGDHETPRDTSRAHRFKIKTKTL